LLAKLYAATEYLNVPKINGLNVFANLKPTHLDFEKSWF